MDVALSGSRPTGKLHIGNYLGAVQNYVKLQEEDFNSFFFIADYHSLTTHPDASYLKPNVRDVLINYLACGLDPEKTAIYIQSDLTETLELYTILNMFANKGELEKVPTFKDKVRQKGQTINAGLLTYPVLMAADILIHRATKVPVGKDQVQHLELTRNFASRFNQQYKTDFLPEPKPYVFAGEPIKVPGLDGSTKMSKSLGDKNCIYLNDAPEDILKKLKKAKTDSGPEAPNSEKPQEVQNLFDIMQSVSDASTFEHFNNAYNNCEIRYGDFKNQIAEDLIAFTKPFRERIAELEKQDDYLKQVTRKGGEQAKESARATIEGVRRIIGIDYY